MLKTGFAFLAVQQADQTDGASAVNPANTPLPLFIKMHKPATKTMGTPPMDRLATQQTDTVIGYKHCR